MQDKALRQPGVWEEAQEKTKGKRGNVLNSKATNPSQEQELDGIFSHYHPPAREHLQRVTVHQAEKRRHKACRQSQDLSVFIAWGASGQCGVFRCEGQDS